MAMTLAQFGDSGAGGFVYITLADGTTIVSNIENNADAYQLVQNFISTSASLTDPTLTVDATYGYRVFGNTAGTEGSLVGASELTRFLVPRSGNVPNFKTSATIAGGVISIDRVASTMFVVVDTEGAVGADNLDTITVAGVVENDTLIIVGANAARIVTLTSGIGNITLSNGTSFATSNSAGQIVLRYIGSTWFENSRQNTLPTVGALRAQSVPVPVNGVNATTLTAGGGTINIEAGVDKGTQVFTGTANLAASWVIQPTAVPTTPYLDGDEIWVIYNAALTSVTGAETVTIFGITLTQQQAIAGAITVRAIYKLSNTTWYADIVYSNQKTTQIWADATARGLAIPDFIGQLGLQIDTNVTYGGTALTAGAWSVSDFLPASGGDTYVLQKTIAGVYSFVPNGTGSNLTNYTTATLDSSTTLTAGTSVPILKITSSSTTVTTANRVITLVPSGTTGVNSNFKIILGYGKIGAGFTWKIKYSSTDLVSLIEGSFAPTVYDCYWNGTTYIVTASADLYSTNTNNDCLAQERVYVAEWSFSQNGGAISTITLPTQFPDGTIVKRSEVVIECVEALTSGGAATVSWGYTGVAAGFDAVRAFSAVPYTTANLVDAGAPASTIPIKLVGNQSVTMTIAGAELTAGYIRVYLPVIINKI